MREVVEVNDRGKVIVQSGPPSSFIDVIISPYPEASSQFVTLDRGETRALIRALQNALATGMLRETTEQIITDGPQPREASR